MKHIEVTEPQAGDWAHHSLGFDPRKVTIVSDAFIWLEIGGDPSVGPCPRENYSFTREVPDE